MKTDRSDMFVNKIAVHGYKSIRTLEGLELRKLNVLIGPNGAGKSNFIGLFRMLSEMSEQRLQIHVQIQGGPDALLYNTRKVTERIHVSLAGRWGGYYFDLIPTHDNRLIFENEYEVLGGHEHAPIHRAIHLGAGHSEVKHPISIADWRVYHFHDTSDTARVKQASAVNDTLRLKTDGANLAAYLRMLRAQYRDSYNAIVNTIRLVAPYFGDFVHREDVRDTVELEWMERDNPDTPFKAHLLSDGTLRFICLATLLLQPWERMPATILIDEPELGLHPYAITVLADLFRRTSAERQLIVSTQSVELLNCLEAEDVIVVDRKNNASTFARLDAGKLADWLDDYSLGELWKQNVLGGRPAR